MDTYRHFFFNFKLCKWIVSSYSLINTLFLSSLILKSLKLLANRFVT